MSTRRGRERSFDSVNVAEARRRIEKTLDSGLGIADVIGGPGWVREGAEALRPPARPRSSQADLRRPHALAGPRR